MSVPLALAEARSPTCNRASTVWSIVLAFHPRENVAVHDKNVDAFCAHFTFDFHTQTGEQELAPVTQQGDTYHFPAVQEGYDTPFDTPVNCDSSTRLTVYIEVAQPPRPPPPPPPSPAVPPLPMSPPTPPPTKWRTAAMKNTIVSLLILCYGRASEAAASYFAELVVGVVLALTWLMWHCAVSWLGFDEHSG
eukprot:5944318-Prymnesium_polylepis.1